METISIKLRRDQLSEKLGGGIPRSSIFLIEGNDGGGKSILCQRFTYGFLQNHATVTYVSTELSTMGFVNQMYSLGYDITEHMLNEELLFIPMFPSIGKVKLRKTSIDKLIKTKKIFEKEIIIFDTLSYLLIQEEFSREKIFTIVKFFKTLTNMGKIVIVAIDPNLIPQDFIKILRSIADMYVVTQSKNVLGNILNVVSVNRFRGAENSVTLEFPFSVKPGSGLTIEIASLS
ncbi:MAG: ATPase domain-containing protein [Candidatus Woesearchaeota archaeon]